MKERAGIIDRLKSSQATTEREGALWFSRQSEVDLADQESVLVKSNGEIKNILVKSFVSSNACPWKPGAIACVNGLMKTKAKPVNPSIISSVTLIMLEARRLASCLLLIRYSENTGIKATEKVPNISKL